MKFNWQKINELSLDKKHICTLTYKNSTSFLLKNYASNFFIEIVSESWQTIDNVRCWERVTVLNSNEQQIMLAITHIPEQTFNKFQYFKELKEEPIGNILFNKKNKWKRSPFKFGTTELNKEDFGIHDNVDNILYTRQSIFEKEKSNLTLTEIFLNINLWTQLILYQNRTPLENTSP